MAWVRFDDQTPEHPKFLGLGSLAPLAGWLWFSAACYSMRHLTNGHVSKEVLARLWSYPHLSVATGGVPGLFDTGEDVEADVLIEALCRARLLEDRGDGSYVVHDFLDYNPSKKDVLSLRRSKQLAGKLGGMAKAQRLAPARVPARPSGTEPPYSPTPTPTPKKKDSPPPSPSSRPEAVAEEVLEHLNRTAKRSFRVRGAGDRPSPNLEFILARLKDGIGPDQLQAIVDLKVKQWRGTEQERYLRPETLFNRTKCEQYLGELPIVRPAPKPCRCSHTYYVHNDSGCLAPSCECAQYEAR